MKKQLLLASILLSGALAAQAQWVAQPEAPASAPDAAYPLHIRVLQAHWHRVRGGYMGFGRANLLDESRRGLDFTYSCDAPFLHNAQHDEFYQARWKKPDQKLEILTQQIGTAHVHRCTLQVTLKDAPYGSAKAPAAQEAPATK